MASCPHFELKWRSGWLSSLTASKAKLYSITCTTESEHKVRREKYKLLSLHENICYAQAVAQVYGGELKCDVDHEF